MIDDLIKSNRTFRRFQQGFPVTRQTLIELVDLARHSASACNTQPLKYFLSCDKETNALIFPTLKWAAALKNWGGPVEGERPSAYIVVLWDSELRSEFAYDAGIASQSIMLGARGRGLGGCMLRNVDKARLRAALDLAGQYEIVMVLALGKPAETVVIEPMRPDGDFRYWRDADGVHHVPKRSLDELILNR